MPAWENPFDASRPTERWLAATAHELWQGLGSWPTCTELANAAHALLGYAPPRATIRAVINATTTCAAA